MIYSKRNFGYELVLDIRDCNELIEKKEGLVKYVIDLCKKIKMKAYGKPIVEYFGLANEKTKGFTVIQLIETSSIVAHFSEEWRTGHINIFSCKYFDQEVVTKFTEKFFQCNLVNRLFLERNG